MFDPMAELDGESNHSSQDRSQHYSDSPRPPRQGKGGNFADEVHSVSIHSEHRTFYIDLKQSERGKFVKVSEKSRNGKKSTIMMDEGDIDEFITAFQEIKKHL